jgi:hypothetical protein
MWRIRRIRKHLFGDYFIFRDYLLFEDYLLEKFWLRTIFDKQPAIENRPDCGPGGG